MDRLLLHPIHHGRVSPTRLGNTEGLFQERYEDWSRAPLGVSTKKSSSFLREMLPITGAPRVTASAVLYDFPVEMLATQAKYPLSCLHSCEIVVQNRRQAHAGEIRPFGAQLNIGVQN